MFSSRWPAIAALLAPPYRRVSLTIWATAFLSLFAIFGLTGWIPTVMLKRGETFAASFGFGALMQAASFVGGLTLATLADRRFTRTPRFLSAWWAVGGFAVLALVFVDGHGFNLAIVTIAGFCIIGAQHVLNNFTLCHGAMQVQRTVVPAGKHLYLKGLPAIDSKCLHDSLLCAEPCCPR